ncbi:MurR/RpiR family transcriptional regulator [Bifidobacterium simiarum]|uniref:MurR/RpiR family transcriptional regulator n=1 Tax=Bifidobacterium simiarum TaxID=2045441 RepID=UPI001BDC431D|nr:hypothetical protein [Bifidobacterium simiarum]MBT1166364.1 MurR/RpiR family transcriptional regulator [Bifidobacterium simiarum]
MTDCPYNEEWHMDSLDSLIKFYDSTDDDSLYHSVVESILTHLGSIETMTIYDLAQVSHSSASTISRLVKKMGFDNYAAFRSGIYFALRNYRYLNRSTGNSVDTPPPTQEGTVVDYYLDNLIEQLLQLKHSLDYNKIRLISDYFNNAGAVHLLSFPAVQIEILQKALIISGKQSHIRETVIEQETCLDRMPADSVVFAIVPDIIEMTPMHAIIRRAKEQGATIITVCSSLANAYAQYSDIQIAFDGSKSSMDLYFFMVIVNILKIDYCNRYVIPMIDSIYG